MPGHLWSPFREGNRSEYLAQYFLSALGVSSPVPRQEDIGIDFYCALAKEDGDRLTFHSPFAVQVGSLDAKSFAYGGMDRKGRWRKEQLDWLFSQELPLFLATVDKETSSFRLYSTSPLWLIRYGNGDVTEVCLIPDARHNPINESRQEVAEYKGKGGDGCRYNVPLGDPLVSLGIEDLRTPAVENARMRLGMAASVEMLNLTYRRLQVHFSQWILDLSKDGSSAQLGQFYAWAAEPGRNTDDQLSSLLPIIVALAHNYKAQSRKEELSKLKAVLSLIPRERIPDFVRTNLPELF